MDIDQRLINVQDVDGAREEIFWYLRKMGNKRIIYFHGWDGLGASAVLRSIAEELPSKRTTPELCFDRIIHIDCSEWKSRRVMQRTIAEQLELPGSVMAMFDKQDEEDDFNAVVESSRDEIRGISRKIHETLIGRSFVVIFINGSDDEIDLYRFGVPSFDEFNNSIMIWTFRKRQLTIQDHQQLVNRLRYTHLLAYDHTQHLTSREFYAILCKEAAFIIDSWPCLRDINPAMVADCCLYEIFLHCDFHNTAKSNWTGHASNYWICDGIMQGDTAWEISNVLYREIKLERDTFYGGVLLARLKPHSFLVVMDEPMDKPCRRISLNTSKLKSTKNMQAIPPETSSFFLASEGWGSSFFLPSEGWGSSFFLPSEGWDSPVAIASSLFEHSRRLSVLVLSCCAFSFATPPFLRCHRLRFLGLDHCEDNKAIEGECHTGWEFLNSLWVLDIRYTCWDEILSEEKMDFMTGLRELNIEGVWCWQYTSRLQGRVPYLRRLRIIKPTHRSEASTTDTSNSFLDKTELEILDLSGNTEMKSLPSSLSKARSLQMLVLDGCDGLVNVVRDGLPHLLRSFSFDGFGPASPWTPIVELPSEYFCPSVTSEKDINISKISLEGCTQLDNLFLRGLPNLMELDLSGTLIKILDFETMVVEVPRLKRLFLLGCARLCAIRWGKTASGWAQPELELLCIDTRDGVDEYPRPSTRQNKPFQLQVHAIVEDAKLARSLWYPIHYYRSEDRLEDVYFKIHIISPLVYSRVVQLEATCKEKTSLDDQVNQRQLVRAGSYRDVLSMVGDAAIQAFTQPPHPQLDRHVEIADGSRNLESELEGDLGFLTGWCAESLHVHDISTSASMPAREWRCLRWCHVERCSKLDTVFPSESYRFYKLETFWVSHLPMARWICSKGFRHYDTGSFRNLQHLHLRSCPRLQFVLPVWVSSFPNLETLHIIHCSDLRHVFVLDGWHPEEISVHGVSFPKLTTIHLHDLPMLRQICEFKMVASALETIKIRGCWGLRRLPVVASRGRGKEKPTIEIEKDMWDALEWDGVEADHHPSHFKAPIHSRYYKEKLPRVSFLR